MPNKKKDVNEIFKKFVDFTIYLADKGEFRIIDWGWRFAYATQQTGIE